MRTSTQLKALIRNKSQEKNVEAEILLRNFMLERFLERMSVSKYKNNFILKGGILISSLVGMDTRTTMDLDASLKRYHLSELELTRIIEDIIAIEIDDNVVFEFRSIESIRDEADYEGFRVALKAKLDRTWQTIKLDISAGDPITPKEIRHEMKLLLEERNIEILAYNLETVLSEKYETIAARGLTNTRMRDFYDIYILTKTQKSNIDKEILENAIEKTASKRGTMAQIIEAEKTIALLENDDHMKIQWVRYRQNNSYVGTLTWETVMIALKELRKSE